MRVAALAWMLLLVSACAAGEITNVGPPASSAEGTPSEVRGVYVPVRASTLVSKRNFVPGAGPLYIYLNPRGGAYTAGLDDSSANVSSVLASTGRSEATIPAWGKDSEAWTRLVDCVRGELGDFNVAVGDLEPESGSYIEAVVGGSGGELGLSGYAGVAPIDTGACKLIDRAVVFVFEQRITDERQTCEAVVAQLGHVFTLDHTYSCQDPMSYLVGCGDRRFEDVELSCGELEERPCVCGRDKQNAVEILNTLIGPRSGGDTPGPSGCGDATYQGACSAEGQLSWCEQGELRTLDCAGHGLECRDSGDGALGLDCLPAEVPDGEPDACMGIDFLGQCSPEGVLTYCLDGQLQTIDCAAFGEACEYVDDEIGNYCVVPPPPPSSGCGDIDFAGVCSEDGVLTYCLQDTLQVVDCAAQARVCAFVSDGVGFGCIDP